MLNIKMGASVVITTTIAIELKQLTVVSYVDELEATTVIATAIVHVVTVISIDIVT